jgi:hypothetical protein
MRQATIATLWLQLTDIYGARFVNVYGDRDSGVWYQALNDLTEKELAFGLHTMMRDVRFETWPPNCTQFRHLCCKNPDRESLPTVHQAFKEARQNYHFTRPVWSHPVIKFTVKQVGLDVVNAARTDMAFAVFKDVYDKVSMRVAHGFKVPDVLDEDVISKRVASKSYPKLAEMLKVKQ